MLARCLVGGGSTWIGLLYFCPLITREPRGPEFGLFDLVWVVCRLLDDEPSQTYFGTLSMVIFSSRHIHPSPAPTPDLARLSLNISNSSLTNVCTHGAFIFLRGSSRIMNTAGQGSSIQWRQTLVGS